MQVAFDLRRSGEASRGRRRSETWRSPVDRHMGSVTDYPACVFDDLTCEYH